MTIRAARVNLSVLFLSLLFGLGATSAGAGDPKATEKPSEVSPTEPFPFSIFSPPFFSDGQLFFPRDGHFLFRGVSRAEMTPSTAIRAMLGDKDVVVATWMFKRLQLLMTGRGLTEKGKDEVIRWALERGLQKEVEPLLSGKQAPLTDAEATAKAKELVNRGFYHLHQKWNIGLMAYFNYRGVRINGRAVYEDAPSDAIFSSIFPNVAVGYSPDVVVHQESRPRSIDLNAFNFWRNGLWYWHPGDVGEFLTPGYITGEDIQGYEMHTRETEQNPIDVAFYRAKVDGEPIVLILDGRKKEGQKSPCIMRTAPLEFVFCELPASNQPQAVAQTPTEEVPRLIGVIRACEPGKECSVPQSLKDKFKLSLLELDARLVAAISRQEVDGKAVRVIYATPRQKGKTRCPKPEDAGLLADYFSGLSFNEQILFKLDREISFDAGDAPFFPGGPKKNFSATWKGYLIPDKTGTHTFLLTSDDGSRFYFNKKLVIDNWQEHGMETKTAVVKLEAGKRYPIQIDYFQKAGGQGLKLEWQPPNGQTQVVPKENLSPW